MLEKPRHWLPHLPMQCLPPLQQPSLTRAVQKPSPEASKGGPLVAVTATHPTCPVAQVHPATTAPKIVALTVKPQEQVGHVGKFKFVATFASLRFVQQFLGQSQSTSRHSRRERQRAPCTPGGKTPQSVFSHSIVVGKMPPARDRPVALHRNTMPPNFLP